MLDDAVAGARTLDDARVLRDALDDIGRLPPGARRARRCGRGDRRVARARARRRRSARAAPRAARRGAAGGRAAPARRALRAWLREALELALVERRPLRRRERPRSGRRAGRSPCRLGSRRALTRAPPTPPRRPWAARAASRDDAITRADTAAPRAALGERRYAVGVRRGSAAAPGGRAGRGAGLARRRLESRATRSGILAGHYECDSAAAAGAAHSRHERHDPMERLGRYQIREIIGEGAMACVYKAFDPEINRALAIKLLKAQLRLDGEYRNRFLREAKGAGVLSHPNIVTVFDVGEDQGHPYIAMELVEGADARRGAQVEEGAVHARHRRDRHPAHARARLRAQEGHHPPRREAGQHHAAHRQQHDQGGRLRHLPHRRQRRQRRHPADADRQRARHAALHVARAGDRREGRLALRPLLGGCRALPAPHRPPAVRGRHADQRRLQDHQDRSAVARQGARRPAPVAAPRSSSAR